MAAVAAGVWWDYSRPAVLNATLTLPLDQANLLLATLTFLVTLAGGSFWKIASTFIHSQRSPVTALELQHQVSLKNSASSIGTVWEAIKIDRAWRAKSPTHQPGLFWKTCRLAMPAAVIWVAFTTASIFASKVANRAGEDIVVRVQPDNCGFMNYTDGDLSSEQAWNTKSINDTIQARNYVSNFYAHTINAPGATSIFVQPSLPYTVNASAPCPIPAAERCMLGPNGAYSMKTGFLDSQTMFGINTKAADRVSLQIETTCSPVHMTGLVNNVALFNTTFAELQVGQITEILSQFGFSPNTTFVYNLKLQTPFTDVGYSVQSINALAQQPDSTRTWHPIAEFNRTDADLTLALISANDIAYIAPVFDPLFSANGTYQGSYNGSGTVYLPDYDGNVIVCADQYVLCNPATGSCTTPGGIEHLSESAVLHDVPGFTVAQAAVAQRLIFALINTGTFNSIAGLGAGALWANNLVWQGISAGLPPTQWQAEAEGWFATALAKLQAAAVQFASNGPTPPAGLVVASPALDAAVLPLYAALAAQCSAQLVLSAGGAQNFSFLGVMVIVVVSVVLVVVSMTIDGCLDGRVKRRGGEPAVIARATDNNLHLLRMALGQAAGGDAPEWVVGSYGIPVLDSAVEFERPDGSEGIGNFKVAGQAAAAAVDTADEGGPINYGAQPAIPHDSKSGFVMVALDGSKVISPADDRKRYGDYVSVPKQAETELDEGLHGYLP